MRGECSVVPMNRLSGGALCVEFESCARKLPCRVVMVVGSIRDMIHPASRAWATDGRKMPAARERPHPL